MKAVLAVVVTLLAFVTPNVEGRHEKSLRALMDPPPGDVVPQNAAEIERHQGMGGPRRLEADDAADDAAVPGTTDAAARAVAAQKEEATSTFDAPLIIGNGKVIVWFTDITEECDDEAAAWLLGQLNARDMLSGATVCFVTVDGIHGDAIGNPSARLRALHKYVYVSGIRIKAYRIDDREAMKELTGLVSGAAEVFVGQVGPIGRTFTPVVEAIAAAPKNGYDYGLIGDWSGTLNSDKAPGYGHDETAKILADGARMRFIVRTRRGLALPSFDGSGFYGPVVQKRIFEVGFKNTLGRTAKYPHLCKAANLNTAKQLYNSFTGNDADALKASHPKWAKALAVGQAWVNDQESNPKVVGWFGKPKTIKREVAKGLALMQVIFFELFGNPVDQIYTSDGTLAQPQTSTYTVSDVGKLFKTPIYKKFLYHMGRKPLTKLTPQYDVAMVVITHAWANAASRSPRHTKSAVVAALMLDSEKTDFNQKLDPKKPTIFAGTDAQWFNAPGSIIKVRTN